MKRTVLLFYLIGLFITGISAQTERTIQGSVMSGGEPLIGASIYVKGTSLGTVTDLDGAFTLPLSQAGEGMLVISYTGYQTLEVAITAENIYAVELSDEGLDLDEVIITALGVKREKKALGYSVQDVGVEALTANKST
ncbi:MAG: carboxypeptidase-like regulatory domain-containing protein, partial [Saprospiraceae bacterium]|nr:carboxypeptidase-like regulatory domain-containing protein [Saprospiraceae bacterium]